MDQVGPRLVVEALREALHELVVEAGASYAAVLDQSNDLWCSTPLFSHVAAAADRFYAAEVADKRDALRRGSRLRVARSRKEPEDSYVAESFAGIYVLLLGFDGEFDPFTADAKLRAALPRIERLTLALPPPDGPVAGDGVRKMRG
jgi:hypothetical protein